MTDTLAQLGNGRQQFFDANGHPIVGGTVGTYIPSTLVPKATYQDAGQTISNTNPLTLDALGSAIMWGNGYYRQIVKDASGNLIWDTESFAPAITTAAVSTAQYFDSVAALQVATIDASIHTVVTAGYYAGGDGGGATYKRSGAPSQYPGASFLSADGAYWIYVPDARGVNAKAFGAIADGAVGVNRVFSGTNNAPTIQQAIDFATYGAKCPVYIPAGDYLINDTLQLSYGIDFHTTVLEGDGVKRRGENSFSGTALLCNFSDRPGLAVNGQRSCVIRQLCLMGTNFNWIESHLLGSNSTTLDDTVLTNWIDPTLNANANSRFAPYAGIAVDPYAGAQPGTHYPNVTFPAWLGTTSQYGKEFSSNVYMENIYIAGFVIATVIQPCNADGNGDFVKFLHSTTEKNVYVLSAGNSQGRAVSMMDCSNSGFYYGLVNTVHGAQLGQFDFVSTNTDWGTGMNILGINDSTQSGSFLFDGGYSESLWRIGDWGNNSGGNNALVFKAYNFHFGLQTTARGYSSDIFASSDGNLITFDGCSFFSYPTVAQFSGQALGFRFENCNLNPPVRANLYSKIAQSFLAGVMFEPTDAGGARPDTFSVKLLNYYNATTGAQLGPVEIKNASYSERALPICAWVKQSRASLQLRYAQESPKIWDTINKASLASCTLVNGVLTGVFSAKTAQQIMYSGPMPGDVIWDGLTRSIFFVRSWDLGTLTFIAEMQTNYKIVAGVKTPINSFNTAVGTLYVGNSRFFLPEYYLRGDISSISPDIVNCGRDDGFAAWMTDDNQIVVNDYLYIDAQLDRFWGVTTTLITAVDSVAKTITLNGNGARDLLVKPLGFFIRQPPANV